MALTLGLSGGTIPRRATQVQGESVGLGRSGRWVEWPRVSLRLSGLRVIVNYPGLSDAELGDLPGFQRVMRRRRRALRLGGIQKVLSASQKGMDITIGCLRTTRNLAHQHNQFSVEYGVDDPVVTFTEPKEIVDQRRGASGPRLRREGGHRIHDALPVCSRNLAKLLFDIPEQLQSVRHSQRPKRAKTSSASTAI